MWGKRECKWGNMHRVPVRRVSRIASQLRKRGFQFPSQFISHLHSLVVPCTKWGPIFISPRPNSANIDVLAVRSTTTNYTLLTHNIHIFIDLTWPALACFQLAVLAHHGI